MIQFDAPKGIWLNCHFDISHSITRDKYEAHLKVCKAHKKHLEMKKPVFVCKQNFDHIYLTNQKDADDCE